jgi:hypothetical protein
MSGRQHIASPAFTSCNANLRRMAPDAMMLSNTSYSAEHDRKRVHVAKVSCVKFTSLCPEHKSAMRA